MSITRDESALMDKRDDLSNAEKEVIDATFDELYHVAEFEQVNAAKDDRAAALEAALIRFILDSREG